MTSLFFQISNKLNLMNKAMLLLRTVFFSFILISFSHENKPNVEEEIIKEIKIGNQIWMLENFDLDYFQNGDIIPQVKSQSEWISAGNNRQPAWCYYTNDPANGKKFGRLYNWYAVNDPGGLAPKGWKIPTDEEWNFLVDFLRGDNVAGRKIKSSQSEFIERDVKGEYAFKGLPGGCRSHCGLFRNLGLSGYWWSSQEINANNSRRYLVLRSNLGISVGWESKKHGYSVRCIKDTKSGNNQILPEKGKNPTCYKANDIVCEIEEKVHKLTNEYRASNGNTRLDHHYNVAFVCRLWSAEQAKINNLSHNGFPHKRYMAYKKEFNKKDIVIKRENICFGSIRKKDSISAEYIAKRIVDKWIRSSGHRANLLASGLKWQATGVHITEDRYYATQIFGKQLVED
jgi:uncharacterized protein (TIGR02145 family)